MKAVLRLVLLYFTGTRLTRGLTVTGLLSLLVSVYVVSYLPQSEHMLAFAFLGQLLFFAGSAFMPLTFSRLAAGKAARLMPALRIKLLASALLTVAIVALPVLLLLPAAFVAGVSGQLSDLATVPGLRQHTFNLALVTYISFCIIASWLYVVLYFFGTQRNAGGVTKGLVVVGLLMLIPLRPLRELTAVFASQALQLVITWSVFGAAFLAWPRLKSALARGRARQAELVTRPGRQITGREVDLMLGTGDRWMFAAFIVITLVILGVMTRASGHPWVFFSMLMSVLTAGISALVVERSRPLWLRSGWTRRELFGRVEKSLWWHHGPALLALLAAVVGMGVYAGMPWKMLVASVAMVALGAAVSTYLGLMLTRGLHWPEATLAIVVMVMLLLAASMTEAPVVGTGLIAILLLLAALAVSFRFTARRRWAHIDWALCRPAKLLAGRGPWGA